MLDPPPRFIEVTVRVTVLNAWFEVSSGLPHVTVGVMAIT
jgi:hypothetical protein